MMSDDDDDDEFEGYYVNGHWEWNYEREELVFIRDETLITEEATGDTGMLIAPVEFKELHVKELIRLQKFMKKPKQNDVVTLQDVKDVVLFTAPRAILTPVVIDILHLSSIDRFFRALILYCQYFLQISEIMRTRNLEMLKKIRTPNSDIIELRYRSNLQDLRLLVAKEYLNGLTGAGEYKKIYPEPQLINFMRSLSIKEAILFDSFIRISIQIVWVSLARKCFHQIEVEVQRLFNSDLFNVAEHKSNTTTKLSPQEMFVLREDCVKHNSKLSTQSPLMNEIRCHRDIDYHLFGLGIVEYPKLSTRLLFLEHVLTLDEYSFDDYYNVTLGIIGLKRSRFGIDLNEIVMPTSSTRATNRSSRMSGIARVAKSSRSKKSTVTVAAAKNPFPDIVLPEQDVYEDYVRDSFPTTSFQLHRKEYVEAQKNKWLEKISRMKRKVIAKRSKD